MEKTITLSGIQHQASILQDTAIKSNASKRNKGRSISGVHQIINAPANTAGVVAANKRSNQSPLFLANRILRI